MKNIKNKIFSLLLIALFTIPALTVLSPSKAMAKTTIHCDGTSQVCMTIGSIVLYGKGTIVID